MSEDAANRDEAANRAGDGKPGKPRRRQRPLTRPPRPEPTSIRWEPPTHQVPSLVDIILDKLADHAQLVPTDAIDSMDGVTATALLERIMRRRRLNTLIAQRFISSRHQDIADALSELDLVAGVPPPGRPPN